MYRHGFNRSTGRYGWTDANNMPAEVFSDEDRFGPQFKKCSVRLKNNFRDSPYKDLSELKAAIVAGTLHATHCDRPPNYGKVSHYELCKLLEIDPEYKAPKTRDAGVDRCIEYLERRGYSVIQPGGKDG